MEYPPLVQGLTPALYRDRFERTYCRGPIATFDGILVRFRKSNFNHAFFESTSKAERNNVFSFRRAERVDWIKAALQDPDAELYVGVDTKRQIRSMKRRVAVVKGDYVVVIAITEPGKADFITAFVDTGPLPGRNFSSIEMIRMNPRWPTSAKKDR